MIGLNMHQSKVFLDLLIVANDEQLKQMEDLIIKEQDKRNLIKR